LISCPLTGLCQHRSTAASRDAHFSDIKNYRDITAKVTALYRIFSTTTVNYLIWY